MGGRIRVQLAGRLEMRSPERIADFLNAEHVGRIATIDADGYPQVIPMNFAYMNGAIYMHSHTRGEKLDNARRNPRVGFEVDRELEFLPSYFEDPTDASLADTLYVSVVAKGVCMIVEDRAEKAAALNALMSKYQPEGRYEPIRPDMDVVDHVSIMRVTPESLRGKYKIGQHMDRGRRARLAQSILERNSATARATLEVMGFAVESGRAVMRDEPSW